MEDFECKIKEMMTQKIDNTLSRRNDRCKQMVLEKGPFAPKIIAVPLPKGFKYAMIEVYDGVTDPFDNLQTLVNSLRLHMAPDAMICL